jgi:tetratricopeptide (TPR) repeat protein
MRARRRIPSLPKYIPLVLALSSSPAWAQSEQDRAAARALATQGIAAFNEGRSADALDLFTRAESLLHAPPHVLYMARSAAKLGQLVKAHELYLKLVREELPAGAPQAFRDAQTQARDEVASIEPRLASITINVKAAPGVAYHVTMDDQPISTAVIGVPFPADPGRHRLMASAPGQRAKAVEVTLADGGRGTAELLLQPDPTAPAALPAGNDTPATASTATSAAVAPPADATSTGPRNAWMRPASFVAFGIGAIGLGSGTYFGLRSRSERKDADNLANQCQAPCLTSDPLVSQIDAKDNSARNHMTISAVSFIVGGLGVAAGTTLFVLSARKPTATTATANVRTATRVDWTPFIGVGSAGVLGQW